MRGSVSLSGPLRWIKLYNVVFVITRLFVSDPGLFSCLVKFSRECYYSVMLHAAGSLNGDPSCKGLAVLLVG